MTELKNIRCASLGAGGVERTKDEVSKLLPASCNVTAVKTFNFLTNYMSRKGKECPRVGKETTKANTAGDLIIDDTKVDESCD